MDHVKMLTQQDLLKFREEIKELEGFYDPKIHAHLFSQSVYKHLDQKFEALGIADPNELKRELITQTLISGKSDVTFNDLITCCESMAIPLPDAPNSPSKSSFNIKRYCLHGVVLALLLCITLFTICHEATTEIADTEPTIKLYTLTNFDTTQAFPYKEIDHSAFMAYLTQKRNGLIGEPYHYYKIITLARAHNIDALLLFAIIGQEQNFVQRDKNDAKQIINNPFNVYHSWETYNTNLSESTLIAINTIKNRLKNQPSDIGAIDWLNQTYAEDPKWHIGVNAFYQYFTEHFLLTNDKNSIPPILNRLQ